MRNKAITQLSENEIKDAIRKASSYLEVLQLLGFKKRTVSRMQYLELFITTNLIDISHFNIKSPKSLGDKTFEQIKAAISQSKSFSDVLKLLGYAHKDINSSQSRRYFLRKFVEEHNIDISHFDFTEYVPAKILKDRIDNRHARAKVKNKESRQRAGEGLQFLEDAARWIMLNNKKSDKAKNRIGNDLELDCVVEKIKDGCSYCGETELKMILDRIESGEHPHSNKNTVGCCVRCNTIKGNMPHVAWLQLVPTIRKIREAGLFGSWKGVFNYGKVTEKDSDIEAPDGDPRYTLLTAEVVSYIRGEAGKKIFQNGDAGKFDQEMSQKLSISKSTVRRIRLGYCYKQYHDGSSITGTTEKPIIQMDLEGNFIREYTSVREAILINNFKANGIDFKSKNVTLYKRFIWKYKYSSESDRTKEFEAQSCNNHLEQDTRNPNLENSDS
jgi:hypothetical protein